MVVYMYHVEITAQQKRRQKNMLKNKCCAVVVGAKHNDDALVFLVRHLCTFARTRT